MLTETLSAPSSWFAESRNMTLLNPESDYVPNLCCGLVYTMLSNSPPQKNIISRLDGRQSTTIYNYDLFFATNIDCGMV